MNSNKLLSDLVAFRTYAKYIPHLNRRESLEETINRNMQMHLDRFPKLSTDIVRAYRQVHELKVLPSMRALQFSGEAIIKNNVRQYNCSALPINNPASFGEVLYLLLSGAGVGFSVQKHHINELPKVQFPTEENIHIVHDSIEGWAAACDALMQAYFYKRIRPLFDFSNIRAKDSYLITTGARAPGPEPLKAMLSKVEEFLKLAIGRKLSSIEVHDIVCIISDCVLSGGIRRSACISLFDRDDSDMMKAKTGDWWVKYPYRARANNSAVLPRHEVTKEEFDAIMKSCQESKSGEPAVSFTNDINMLFNPCQPAFAKLTLANGKETTMGELEVGDVLLNCRFQETVVLKKWSNGVKPVYAYGTDHGSFVGTAEHRVVTHISSDKVVKEQIDKVYTNAYSRGVETHKGNASVDYKVYLGDYEVFDITVSDDTHTYLTNGIFASNCHEIALNPHQLCNLTTINQTGIKDEKDFLKRVYAATLVGTLQASYTNFPYLRNIWQETTEKEALLGVSFTGIADANGIVTQELLRKGAALVKEVNEKYARKIGINIAARTTTVKPEGSSSCVLGSSSGIHSRHSKYYLRRFRINRGDSLDNYLRHTIPELVEDDIFSATGSVVTIPQESPLNAITREQESALDLLNRAYMYNEHWIKEGHRSGANMHNVSCTVSIKDNEWELVKESMWNNRYKYSGISLLPYEDSSYQQMPFEACSEEIYNKYINLVKEINLTEIREEQDNTKRSELVACSGGVCEITSL